MIKGLVLTVFLACPFYAFGEDKGDLEAVKAATIKDAIDGCFQSIFEPNVTQLMKRMEEAGKPFASREAAKQAMTGMKQWPGMESSMRGMCECNMEPQISAIKSAKSRAAIEKALQSAQTPDQNRVKQCAEKYMPKR